MISEIASRAVGKFPLSLATSLALESICGISDEAPQKIAPILKYPVFWINIRTLIRNFIGALDKDTANAVTDHALIPQVWQEIEMIESVIKEYNSQTRIQFYVSEYKGLVRKYPNASLRSDSTEKQKIYTLLVNNTIAGLLHYQDTKKIAVFERSLEPREKQKTLILTNYAFDLLSARNFGELTLLESHTGILKGSDQWYTKFSSGKYLNMIPFTEAMLQIFGDSMIFRSQSHAVRNAVIETANKFNWSSITTTERIKTTISFMQDPKLKDQISLFL